MNQQVRDDARKTIEILKERGRCKGRGWDPATGSVCVARAMNMAASDRRDDPTTTCCNLERFNALRYAAEKTLGVSRPIDVVNWNDHPSTTDEQVVAMLETVATTA